MDAGRNSVCVANGGLEYVELRFKLEQGIEAKDNDSEPKEKKTTRDELVPIEEQLSKSVLLTDEISKNMNDLRIAGGDQQLMSESTTITVIVLGCISLGVVIASTWIQNWYLKSFFKQRKLL